MYRSVLCLEGAILRHCDINIDELDVWFLADINGFTKRTLKIARCYNCKRELVELTELRMSDNQVFLNVLEGEEARNTARRERKRISYTLRQTLKYPDKWIYGVNKERHNKFGNVTSIVQYACRCDGKKKVLLKTIKVAMT